MQRLRSTCALLRYSVQCGSYEEVNINLLNKKTVLAFSQAGSSVEIVVMFDRHSPKRKDNHA